MKILLPVIAFLIFTLSTEGQIISDTEAVLKKCIELPEIQEQVNKEADNVNQVIYIMQHAVTFPEDMNLSDSGIELIFMSKDEIYNNNTEAFFRFDKFDVNETNAEAAFDFEYNRYSNGNPLLVKVRLKLRKQQSGWIITKSDFN